MKSKINMLTVRILVILCLFGYLKPAFASYTTYDDNYIKQMDNAVNMYHRGQYANARQIFFYLFKNPDGTYHTNPVIFSWLVAAMIKSGATREELLAFSHDVIQKSPGGPAVSMARQLMDKWEIKEVSSEDESLKTPPSESLKTTAEPEPEEKSPAVNTPTLPTTEQTSPNQDKLAKNHLVRGLSYLERQQYGAALAEFNMAIKIKPDYALAYFNKGLVNYRQDKLSQAIASFTNALIYDPKMTRAYYNRGLAYQAMGLKEAAEDDFKRAAPLK